MSNFPFPSINCLCGKLQIFESLVANKVHSSLRFQALLNLMPTPLLPPCWEDPPPNPEERGTLLWVPLSSGYQARWGGGKGPVHLPQDCHSPFLLSLLLWLGQHDQQCPSEWSLPNSSPHLCEESLHSPSLSVPHLSC